MTKTAYLKLVDATAPGIRKLIKTGRVYLRRYDGEMVRVRSPYYDMVSATVWRYMKAGDAYLKTEWRD